MKRALIGSLALSLAAGIASAQTAAPAAGASPAAAGGAAASMDFNTIDANSDGRLSSAEVRSHAELNTAFTTLDTDSDTYLSQTEYSKWNKGAKSGSKPGSPPRSGDMGAAPAAPGATRNETTSAPPGAGVESPAERTNSDAE